VNLKIDSIRTPSWQIRSFKSLILGSQDLLEIDSLFQNFMIKSNSGSTTVHAMGAIGRMNYKRQYIPGVNLKGEKTVDKLFLY